jgi:hypothetical protein
MQAITTLVAGGLYWLGSIPGPSPVKPVLAPLPFPEEHGIC